MAPRTAPNIGATVLKRLLTIHDATGWIVKLFQVAVLSPLAQRAKSATTSGVLEDDGTRQERVEDMLYA